MHGTDRTLVNPSTNARDEFAALDERKQLEIDEALAAQSHGALHSAHTVFGGDGVHDAPVEELIRAYGFDDDELTLELNARELERVALHHRGLAVQLEGLAARLREGVVPTKK